MTPTEQDEELRKAINNTTNAKLNKILIALAWEVDAAASGYQKNRSKSKSIADLYSDGIAEAKQAILDWHNKQVAAVLNELDSWRDTHNVDTGCDDEVLFIPYSALEAERKRINKTEKQ